MMASSGARAEPKEIVGQPPLTSMRPPCVDCCLACCRWSWPLDMAPLANGAAALDDEAEVEASLQQSRVVAMNLATPIHNVILPLARVWSVHCTELEQRRRQTNGILRLLGCGHLRDPLLVHCQCTLQQHEQHTIGGGGTQPQHDTTRTGCCSW